MFDAIIIGGGPAGLTAAIYLLRAEKKVLVIEKEAFGGQITKASKVENYPGFKSVSGIELGSNMYEQAKNLGMHSIYGEATKIRKEKNVFHVFVSSEVYEGRAIIFATGTTSRKLGLVNETQFIGKGISFCATCDGAFFKDKVVCVVGGGNTAIEDALYLSNICKKVYLVHRGNIFRAEPIRIKNVLEKDNIEIIYQAVVKEIKGMDKLESILLYQEDCEKELFIDGLFVAIGVEPNTVLLKDLLSLESNGYVKTNYFLETSVSGLFIAGDVREKKVRQLTTAVSDGTISALEVLDYLDVE